MNRIYLFIFILLLSNFIFSNAFNGLPSSRRENESGNIYLSKNKLNNDNSSNYISNPPQQQQRNSTDLPNPQFPTPNVERPVESAQEINNQKSSTQSQLKSSENTQYNQTSVERPIESAQESTVKYKPNQNQKDVNNQNKLDRPIESAQENQISKKSSKPSTKISKQLPSALNPNERPIESAQENSSPYSSESTQNNQQNSTGKYSNSNRHNDNRNQKAFQSPIESAQWGLQNSKSQNDGQFERDPQARDSSPSIPSFRTPKNITVSGKNDVNADKKSGQQDIKIQEMLIQQVDSQNYNRNNDDNLNINYTSIEEQKPAPIAIPLPEPNEEFSTKKLKLSQKMIDLNEKLKQKKNQLNDNPSSTHSTNDKQLQFYERDIGNERFKNHEYERIQKGKEYETSNDPEKGKNGRLNRDDENEQDIGTHQGQHTEGQKGNDEFRRSRTSTAYPEDDPFNDEATDLQTSQTGENFQAKDAYSLTYTLILILLFLLSLIVLCLVCQRLVGSRCRLGKNDYQEVAQLDILHPTQIQSHSQPVVTQTGYQYVAKVQPTNVDNAKTKQFFGVPTPFEQAEIIRRSSSPKY